MKKFFSGFILHLSISLFISCAVLFLGNERVVPLATVFAFPGMLVSILFLFTPYSRRRIEINRNIKMATGAITSAILLGLFAIISTWLDGTFGNDFFIFLIMPTIAFCIYLPLYKWAKSKDEKKIAMVLNKH